MATNTDEESSGAGGTALVEHGLRADAGIVTEPTGFDAWVACRGSEYGVITVPGRPGHAEVKQPDWRAGGAVNAIEKAAVVLEAIASLRREWSQRDGFDHPFLSRPALLPTMARSGEWPVTYPASCELTIAVDVPARAGRRARLGRRRPARGRGVDRARDRRRRLAGRAPADDRVVAERRDAVRDQPRRADRGDRARGRRATSAGLGRLGGLDSWYDGATITELAGIPSIGYGPPGFDADGVSVAHMVDEFVPVDGLIACAQALAVTAMRFCGSSD